MSLFDVSEQMDEIFSNYEAALGGDFQPYRNHCFRVFNYMEHFFLSDSDIQLAVVLVPFHDLGIWTHHTMDYLQPSCDEAEKFIKKRNLNIPKQVIHEVIKDHHKITSATTALAEKLRKADLIDLSQGLIRFDIPRSLIKEIRKNYPYLGFHYRIYRKVIGHAIRHPLHPFPMLKR